MIPRPFFLGLAALPLAEAVAIFFVSPLLIAVFSIIFLGDTAVGKSCIISAMNGHPINVTHEVLFMT